MAVNQIISNFINVASQKDFARNNLFRVMSFKTRLVSMDESELIYCRSAKIPGRETPIAQVQFNGMKLNYNKSTVEYPGSDSYELEFYLDADSELRKKFEQFSRLTFNDISNTGDWRFPASSDVLTIALLGFNMEPIKYFHLHGVALKSVEAIDAKPSDGDGSAVTFKVILSYHYYRTEGSEVIYTE